MVRQQRHRRDLPGSGAEQLTSVEELQAAIEKAQHPGMPPWSPVSLPCTSAQFSFLEQTPHAWKVQSQLRGLPLLAGDPPSQGPWVPLSVLCSVVAEDLVKLVKDCSFVGMADPELALLQHSTALYLVNVTSLRQDVVFSPAFS